jgi:hypothetical protein
MRLLVVRLLLLFMGIILGMLLVQLLPGMLVVMMLLLLGLGPYLLLLLFLPRLQLREKVYTLQIHLFMLVQLVLGCW